MNTLLVLLGSEVWMDPSIVKENAQEIQKTDVFPSNKQVAWHALLISCTSSSVAEDSRFMSSSTTKFALRRQEWHIVILIYGCFIDVHAACKTVARALLLRILHPTLSSVVPLCLLWGQPFSLMCDGLSARKRNRTPYCLGGLPPVTISRSQKCKRCQLFTLSQSLTLISKPFGMLP